MYRPSLTDIPRTLGAFFVMWLMFPHQPTASAHPSLDAAISRDARCQTDKDGTCDSEVFASMRGSIASIETARNDFLNAIMRVRSDIRSNRTSRD